MKARKSIVLVTVDCLRADHVGFMGYQRPVTPFLDSLARESLVIPSAIVVGAPTYYSLPGILASRYPLAQGRDVLGLGPDEPTLASVLKAAGYCTAAFAAGNPYISARFGYERGFDTFRDFLERDATSPASGDSVRETASGWASRLNRKLQQLRPAMGPLGIIYDELYFNYCQRMTESPASLDILRRFPAADEIVGDACKWLSSVGDAPYFLWLHLMDPHAPYYPKDAALNLIDKGTTAPYRARYLNSYWNRSDLGPRRLQRHRDEIVLLYDAGIRWVDEQLARLVRWLQQTNHWDDCIFALTADHGEGFLDHGGRYHPPEHLMEELIHVPLLVRVPESPKRDLEKVPFSLIHLAPTLLDAVAVPIPRSFQGHSYWPQMQRGEQIGGIAISECVAGCTNPFHGENRLGSRLLSVRESRYKLVLHFDQFAETLYDLEADPGEQSPVAPSSQKPVRRRLLDLAREHLRQSFEDRDLHERTKMRLRELQIEWQNSARNGAHLPS